MYGCEAWTMTAKLTKAIDGVSTRMCDGANTRVYHYDVAFGSEITPCYKICKPLVVYRFTGNVITSITTLRT